MSTIFLWIYHEFLLFGSISKSGSGFSEIKRIIVDPDVQSVKCSRLHRPTSSRGNFNPSRLLLYIFGKFWKFKNHLYLEITKRENKLFIINYMAKKNHNILITLINEFMNNQKTYSSGQHKAWKKFDIEQTWQNV